MDGVTRGKVNRRSVYGSLKRATERNFNNNKTMAQRRPLFRREPLFSPCHTIASSTIATTIIDTINVKNGRNVKIKAAKKS